jgi:hypothetical protein
MDISSELAKISSYKGFFTLTVGGDGAGYIRSGSPTPTAAPI